MGLSGTQETTTLRDYLQVLRRRWAIILTVVVLTAVSAAYFSTRQEKLYEASAQVLVRSGFDSSQPPERVLQTQADIATASPEVEQRVRDELGLQSVPEIRVTPKTESDILVFSSTASSPDLAERVATGYGRAFSDFQLKLATQDIEKALRNVEAEIEAIAPGGRRPLARDRAEYDLLLDKRQELQTSLTLETSRALLVRPAANAAQVQPKPVRDILLGSALGLILGIGLAFLREALDTRVRSTEEVARHLGIPLLARVPAPPRRLRRDDRLVMISDPDGPGAEAFRVLRANVDFARIATDARTLLVTSAVDGEGKSTTAANLAIAMARAGHSVALVDFDLRRPYLHKFFNLEGPGIAQVASGSATLEDAVVPIPLVWSGRTLRDGTRQSGGMLKVLPAVPMPANLDEVLATHVITGVLAELRTSSDIVVVDSTPLVVGDAMALTAAVDALLVVTRMESIRRPMLDELRRILDAIPAQTIGFAATGIGSTAGYSGYIDDYHRPRSRQKERVS